jgi:hypothetical protein
MPWSLLRELLFAGVLLVFIAALSHAIRWFVVELGTVRPTLDAWIDVAWLLGLTILVYRRPGPIWQAWLTDSTWRLLVVAVALLLVGLAFTWRIGWQLQRRREAAFDFVMALACALRAMFRPPRPEQRGACPACAGLHADPPQRPRLCHECRRWSPNAPENKS